MLPLNADPWPWLLVFVILAAVLGPVATLRYLARLEQQRAHRRERRKGPKDPPTA